MVAICTLSLFAQFRANAFSLDQYVFAESSNFGYEEVTLFVVADTETVASGVEIETVRWVLL